jgi:xanthine dehydrogenase accessory factor
VLSEDHPRLVPYGISDEMAFNVGLACGGMIEVFIQPYEKAIPLAEPVAYAYVLDGEQRGAGLFVSESGAFRGSLGLGVELDARVAADAARRLRDGQPARETYPDAPGGPVEVFVDTYAAKPTLYIFGAVQIGVSLARFAKQIGFNVVVIDARGSWARRERFPEADEIHIQRADDFLAAHPLGHNAYVAVLSHQPELDDPALLGALRSPARYVGAVGSSKTQKARRGRLLKGGVTEEQYARLRGPIGLDIGAQNPEEIAIAILGEMLAAKYGRLQPSRAPEHQLVAI